ncbi:MAG: hypothetical protein LBK40_01420 [Spirochaetaceae bacterium]|jgi:hypothetical protein|nr:hypothetical protein [Spirochaetaceae bacterium]
MASTVAIMEKGINILLEHLGDLDTEQFISTLLRESFDYTEWRRKHLAEYAMNPEELNRAAIEFDKTIPLLDI